jgi:hypothetical protein
MVGVQWGAIYDGLADFGVEVNLELLIERVIINEMR